MIRTEENVVTHRNVVIGTTSTLIVLPNKLRRFLIIQNRSNEDVDIKIGEAAVSGEGIQLAATDASSVRTAFELNPSMEVLASNAIYGICASGSKTISVTEIE